jgi:adenylylsulfate kinase
MAQLLGEQGTNVIIDATGNRKRYRELARRLIPEFAEVYVKCPLEVCMNREGSRDSSLVDKGLYRKARSGDLSGGMPGVSSPYDEPEDPEVTVDSSELSPGESADRIMDFVRSRWTG